MKRKTVRYIDDKCEIIGELQRIQDDLPSPDELADIVPQTKSRLRSTMTPWTLSSAKRGGAIPATSG